jgi:hypothetical protein
MVPHLIPDRRLISFDCCLKNQTFCAEGKNVSVTPNAVTAPMTPEI